jgi:CBS domain-containing protein
MKVQDLMTWEIDWCTTDSDLGSAAMEMWRRDCGIVPVVESDSRKLVGVITDRDICMATATQRRDPYSLRVGDVMSKRLFTCSPADDARAALRIMKEGQVRRLPVVDPKGTLQGIISLNDLALAAQRTGRPGEALSFAEVMEAVQGVSRHRVRKEMVEAATA